MSYFNCSLEGKLYKLIFSRKSPDSLSKDMELLVSVGVQSTTEITHSGNKVMSK